MNQTIRQYCVFCTSKLFQETNDNGQYKDIIVYCNICLNYEAEFWVDILTNKISYIREWFSKRKGPIEIRAVKLQILDSEKTTFFIKEKNKSTIKLEIKKILDDYKILDFFENHNKIIKLSNL